MPPDTALPALSHRDTPTPGFTTPATPVTPAEEICTREHALYAFDVLAAHYAGREPIAPPFLNAKDKL